MNTENEFHTAGLDDFDDDSEFFEYEREVVSREHIATQGVGIDLSEFAKKFYGEVPIDRELRIEIDSLIAENEKLELSLETLDQEIVDSSRQYMEFRYRFFDELSDAVLQSIKDEEEGKDLNEANVLSVDNTSSEATTDRTAYNKLFAIIQELESKRHSINSARKNLLARIITIIPPAPGHAFDNFIEAIELKINGLENTNDLTKIHHKQEDLEKFEHDFKVFESELSKIDFSHDEEEAAIETINEKAKEKKLMSKFSNLFGKSKKDKDAGESKIHQNSDDSVSAFSAVPAEFALPEEDNYTNDEKTSDFMSAVMKEMENPTEHFPTSDTSDSVEELDLGLQSIGDDFTSSNPADNFTEAGNIGVDGNSEITDSEPKTYLNFDQYLADNPLEEETSTEESHQEYKNVDFSEIFESLNPKPKAPEPVVVEEPKSAKKAQKETPIEEMSMSNFVPPIVEQPSVVPPVEEVSAKVTEVSEPTMSDFSPEDLEEALPDSFDEEMPPIEEPEIEEEPEPVDFSSMSMSELNSLSEPEEQETEEDFGSLVLEEIDEEETDTAPVYVPDYTSSIDEESVAAFDLEGLDEVPESDLLSEESQSTEVSNDNSRTSLLNGFDFTEDPDDIDLTDTVVEDQEPERFDTLDSDPEFYLDDKKPAVDEEEGPFNSPEEIDSFLHQFGNMSAEEEGTMETPENTTIGNDPYTDLPVTEPINIEEVIAMQEAEDAAALADQQTNLSEAVESDLSGFELPVNDVVDTELNVAEPADFETSQDPEVIILEAPAEEEPIASVTSFEDVLAAEEENPFAAPEMSYEEKRANEVICNNLMKKYNLDLSDLGF